MKKLLLSAVSAFAVAGMLSLLYAEGVTPCNPGVTPSSVMYAEGGVCLPVTADSVLFAE
ncbi:hypothetical protein HZA38_01375 [Candidatus Peregrinibacteria bacterium]|nr:hypothetical protein [Candidatus Peregrinibacteria bacterium]